VSKLDRWESGTLADGRLKVIDLCLLYSQSPNVAVVAVRAAVLYRTRLQILIRSPAVHPKIFRRCPHFLQAV